MQGERPATFPLLTATVLLLACLAAPARAENDGPTNNFRALETVVASPAGECAGNQATLPPILRGLHDRPQGYVHDGQVYLFTHSVYWPDEATDRNCSNQFAPTGACLKSDGEYIPEYSLLYRAPHTAAGMTSPFQRIGYVGPCFTASDPPGDEAANRTVAYAGRPAVGGNGRFYFFVTRARCFEWNDDCFNELYMGAVFDPDNRSYVYRWQPLLRSSVVNGTRYGFLEPSLAPWDSPGPKPFTRLDTPVGQATMWGYIQFGEVPGGPSRIAAIQIVDVTPASIARPRWYNTAAFLLGTDNQWHMANQSTGAIDFVPMDLSGQFFPLVSLQSLFYNSSDLKWYALGEDPLHATAPPYGCSRDGHGWGNTSIVAALPPNTGKRTFAYDTYTQNRWHQGGFLVELNGTKYLYRGSTENACFNVPQWTPGTPGSEITVETLTNF